MTKTHQLESVQKALADRMKRHKDLKKAVGQRETQYSRCVGLNAMLETRLAELEQKLRAKEEELAHRNNRCEQLEEKLQSAEKQLGILMANADNKEA